MVQRDLEVGLTDRPQGPPATFQVISEITLQQTVLGLLLKAQPEQTAIKAQGDDHSYRTFISQAHQLGLNPGPTQALC